MPHPLVEARTPSLYHREATRGCRERTPMRCKECGTENDPGTSICRSCGSELAANPYAAPPGVGVSANRMLPGYEKPKNYLVQSILVTVCCCLPIGIAAIVYSAQVDSKWNAGDHLGAIDSSRKANQWGWIAFALGFIVNVIAFLLQMGAAGMQEF